ncbi:MAG: hypothetical protein CME26_15565 [Gemmatimonadetes bacterium]|nr:hypothetical protein [Gemmatimonadota bacterium]|tara:strand:+ start:13171 stop:13800 length:630 start_codon:yes stop_codon:yes gene_type:complete
MKALVLCEDCAHPASLTIDGLNVLEDHVYEFTFVEDPNTWSAGWMAEFPLVVFSKANQTSASDKTPWASEKIAQAFVDYVSRGRAILFLHSGTALYTDIPPLRDLMGGIFVRHPPQCEVTVEPKAGHTMTSGSDTFTVKDEHYLMEMNDPAVDVFLHTHSEHGTQPAGWTRQEGNGRVAVLTPGHNPEGWVVPSYQALLRNCLDWCAGR